MKFKFDIRWRNDDADGEEVDPRLFILLKNIRDRGSLREAADVCGVSYRFAWELFRLWQQRFGQPLAIFERGRGASLSALGEKILWAEKMLYTRLQPDLTDLGAELQGELDKVLMPGAKDKVIRMHASHDLVMAQFESLCQQSTVFDIDFQIRGSLEALRQLAAGQCDIAGFHFPRGELSSVLQAEYRPWLDESKLRLLQVVVRQQGLMTQAGNQRHINAIQDLGRRSVRFINRQKNSGTRIIFDALLKHGNIDRSRIRGYHDEEFTHLAVAAMLASGAADVGFGIKAAAAKFNLPFIPLVEESYVLAISNKVTDKVFGEIKRLLRTEDFKKKIKALPGYLPTNTGKLVSLEKLLSGK